jgi:hypothetical protein
VIGCAGVELGETLLGSVSLRHLGDLALVLQSQSRWIAGGGQPAKVLRNHRRRLPECLRCVSRPAPPRTSPGIAPQQHGPGDCADPEHDSGTQSNRPVRQGPGRLGFSRLPTTDHVWYIGLCCSGVTASRRVQAGSYLLFGFGVSCCASCLRAVSAPCRCSSKECQAGRDRHGHATRRRRPARVIPHGRRDHPSHAPNRRTHQEVPMSAPDTCIDEQG